MVSIEVLGNRGFFYIDVSRISRRSDPSVMSYLHCRIT
jgi:hypothetical protein